MTTSTSVTQNSQYGDQVNLSHNERWLSMLAGGIMILYGLSRFSFAGLALAAGGSYLVYRALTGHCAVYDAVGMSSRLPGPVTGIHVEKTVTIGRPGDQDSSRQDRSEDPVEEAAQESFPASDSPAWTSRPTRE